MNVDVFGAEDIQRNGSQDTWIRARPSRIDKGRAPWVTHTVEDPKGRGRQGNWQIKVACVLQKMEWHPNRVIVGVGQTGPRMDRERMNAIYNRLEAPGLSAPGMARASP